MTYCNNLILQIDCTLKVRTNRIQSVESLKTQYTMSQKNDNRTLLIVIGLNTYIHYVYMVL